ncbi:hypothetical protein MR798_10145, partial [bacterium]|nr:hypothetical protein [bacterium]
MPEMDGFRCFLLIFSFYFPIDITPLDFPVNPRLVCPEGPCKAVGNIDITPKEIPENRNNFA